MADPGKADIIVIRGPRGIGKTSLVLGLRDLLDTGGKATGGIACPSERGADGRPVRIHALDLRSGERRLLADRDRDLDGPFLGPERDAAAAGLKPLSFSAATFLWAIASFRTALDPGPGPGLLALDEVGSLELDRYEGFFPILDLIAGASGDDGPAFVITVRDALAGRIMDRLPGERTALVSLSAENRAWMPGTLAGWLERRRTMTWPRLVQEDPFPRY